MYKLLESSCLYLYFWSQDPYNRYVVVGVVGTDSKILLENSQNWKLSKMKVIKIENCQNWKLPKLKSC